MPRLKYFLAALLFLATSCGGLDVPTATESTEPVTSSTVGDSAPAATTAPPATTAAPLTVDQRLGGAVDRLLESDSYAFEVTVTIAAGSEDVEMELEGWVQGSDRYLLLRSGSDEVTTRVLNGVATVERAGETVEVPLEEASDAPTLDILRSLRKVASTADGEITGSLPANDLKDLGFDVTGGAEVIVMISPSGSLSGYVLTGNNGAWTVATRFFDIGESFQASG